MLLVYIDQLFDQIECGNHVFHVTWKQLKNINKLAVYLKNSATTSRKLCLQGSDKFSHLKSLGEYFYLYILNDFRLYNIFYFCFSF